MQPSALVHCIVICLSIYRGILARLSDTYVKSFGTYKEACTRGDKKTTSRRHTYLMTQ